MITKQEFCTKGAVQGVPSPYAEAAADGSVSKRIARRLLWDIALCLGASAYVAVVLFDDVEGPLLSMALIILLAYELIEPRLSKR